MRLSDGDRPAPRREADMEAIESLYEEGMVFQGRIDVPVLDIRPWLEPVLDMHNSHQSFAARQRIREKMGTAAHQVIWFADTRPDIFQGTNFNMAARALAVMDRWMLNILDRTDGEPTPSEIAANRPQGARDTCFTQEGEIIARGNNVWNGILDDRAEGRCARRFEIYAQSRVEAGGPITGDIFKCALKPVDRALTDGTYAGRSFTAAQKDRLREIFPKGVCDFSKEDVGKQPLKSRPIR